MALRPWALDFTPDEAGNPPFPHDYVVDPYAPSRPRLKWKTDDSDPALQFWTLPFDRHLNRWLESVDPSALSSMAALEFAGQFDKWNKWNKWNDDAPDNGLGLLEGKWLELGDLLWLPFEDLVGHFRYEISGLADDIKKLGDTTTPGNEEPPPSGEEAENDLERFENELKVLEAEVKDKVEDLSERVQELKAALSACGFRTICAEIEQLQQLMQDDRFRYLAETEWQADGTADYFIHFLGATRARHPWTIELIRCAMSISHIAHMYFKHRFRRVRPSFLCPGLVPPFGPPAHPSFPSGHSSQAHLIALLLLEIPGLQRRFGVFSECDPKDPKDNGECPCTRHKTYGEKPDWFVLNATDNRDGRSAVDSPLLWLAQRIAKNRERIGVHYASDSSGSRHIAAALWRGLRMPDSKDGFVCPTLDLVIERATAEWPMR